MYFAFCFFRSSADTNSVLIFFSLKISTTELSVTAFRTDVEEPTYLPNPILE
jgi:hypothetical protein